MPVFRALHRHILALRSHVEQGQEAKAPTPKSEGVPSNEGDSNSNIPAP